MRCEYWLFHPRFDGDPASLRDRPMAGEIVLSIGADIANGEKWRQSRRWMFAEETGLLLGISDSVGLCIDLDARRSIPMPFDVIEAIERSSLPQFA